MGRVKIEVSGKFLTRLSIPVRITDINYGNHTGNDSLVGILHEARAAWLKQHGFTELDINGTGLILSELLVNFKKESIYGDTLEIELFASEITKKSFELYYVVNTNRMGETLEIAIAKTTMISYDYEFKKVIEIPDALAMLLT